MIGVIAITVIWVIGLTVFTQPGMGGQKIRRYAETKNGIIWEPVILCYWCMPSIHSVFGYFFYYLLQWAVGGDINMKLLVMYPIVVLASSFLSGITWTIYLTLNTLLNNLNVFLNKQSAPRMTTIYEIAELAYNQLFPNATIQAPIKLEHFVETAKLEYAGRMYFLRKEERRLEGEWNPPSELIVSVEKEVIDDKYIDISDITPMRSIPDDGWLFNMGGNCECDYTRIPISQNAIFCGMDGMDNVKYYSVLGNKIILHKGAHSGKLSFNYVTDGTDVGNGQYVDDVVGAFVRSRLIDIYTRKGQEDKTNNNNSNN